MVNTEINPSYTEYGHTGWMGTPGESDFIASWGVVTRDEIFDGSSYRRVSQAGRAAEAAGFKYLYHPKLSRYGSSLFRRWSVDCFLCVNAYAKNRQSNLDKKNDQYRSSPAARVRQIVRGAQQRAKEKGIPFDLDEDEIVDRVLNGRCEATGAAFDLVDVGTLAVKNPFGPSLDQKVPGAGYTKENVQIVLWGWNLLKSNFDAIALQRLVGLLAVLPAGFAA